MPGDATEPAARASGFERALADARLGGERGLSELFGVFQPRLLRYLSAREPGRADDLAGETWLAVATGIRSFNGNVGAFSAWIFTIARQRLADHRRTAARRRTDPVAQVPHTVGTTAERIALDRLGAQDAVDLIARSLNDDQGEVVLLRVLAGLSAAEVAAVMGREETWVRVTHHRAIAKLRERIVPDQL